MKLLFQVAVEQLRSLEGSEKLESPIKLKLNLVPHALQQNEMNCFFKVSLFHYLFGSISLL